MNRTLAKQVISFVNRRMDKKNIIAILLFMFNLISNAQVKTDSLHIIFNVKFGKSSVELNKQYITPIKDTIALKSIKCYIPSIQIDYSDNTFFKQKESYHLIDIENPKSWDIPITLSNDKIITKVVFNIGIDSLTNTSGALNGDLDPLNGMYWAWQSGYINLKIEGESSSCKTRKNEFHFHIGGYLPPFATMRKIELILDKKANKINIGMDLNEFFSNIRLSETNSIMIPGELAMKIADYTTNLFYIE
jgi:hypothetical protein